MRRRIITSRGVSVWRWIVYPRGERPGLQRRVGIVNVQRRTRVLDPRQDTLTVLGRQSGSIWLARQRFSGLHESRAREKDIARSGEGLHPGATMSHMSSSAPAYDWRIRQSQREAKRLPPEGCGDGRDRQPSTFEMPALQPGEVYKVSWIHASDSVSGLHIFAARAPSAVSVCSAVAVRGFKISACHGKGRAARAENPKS